MWEFWKSKLSQGKTRHRRPDFDPDSPMRASVNREGRDDFPPPVDSSSSHIYFKDIILPASDEELSESDDGPPEHLAEPEAASANIPGAMAVSSSGRRRRGIDRQKLIIILVGLPGRGKTFLCNKLMCYLNWLGHTTAHFNVGQYRRKQNEAADVQDASFFDHTNPAGIKMREAALHEALDEMIAWLETPSSQVAIFDATNSTESRRQTLRRRFHGHFQYLFIESICNDDAVLEQNYRYKMMYSPDYAGFNDEQAALDDFRNRIRKYEDVYETITNRDLHYIKLIDMVTGRGYMDVNRISGYIPGKIVFFLMQVCKAGLSRMRKIWLTRHGQSISNTMELLGGDSHLSPRGCVYAQQLPDVLINRVPLTTQGTTMPVSVWTSTLQRTIQTAEQIPFPKLRWKVLDEIQAGVFDGMTYAQIEQTMPEEFAARKADKLGYRYPSGESYLDVIQRLEPVIIEIERERECVCVVAHQAILRALYGYFMKVPLQDIPRLEMPLHTLIELVPKPDGKMAETRIKVDVEKDFAAMQEKMEADKLSPGADSPSTPQTGVWNQHTGMWTTPSTLLSNQLSNQLSLGTNAAQLQRAMSGVGVEVFMPGRRAALANGKSEDKGKVRPSPLVPIQSGDGLAQMELASGPTTSTLGQQPPAVSLAHSGIAVSAPVAVNTNWGARDSMDIGRSGNLPPHAYGERLPTIPPSPTDTTGSLSTAVQAGRTSISNSARTSGEVVADQDGERQSSEAAPGHRRGTLGGGRPLGDKKLGCNAEQGSFSSLAAPSPFASMSNLELPSDETASENSLRFQDAHSGGDSGDLATAKPAASGANATPPSDDTAAAQPQAEAAPPPLQTAATGAQLQSPAAVQEAKEVMRDDAPESSAAAEGQKPTVILPHVRDTES